MEQRKNDILCLTKAEQRETGLGKNVHASMAPRIFSDLISEIEKGGVQRQELNSCDTYDIQSSDRQTLSVSIEDRLITLDLMHQDLGKLAAAEIVGASLRHAEEFEGLIDFSRLHYKPQAL
ncbi:MAG TPA: hypothetical protein VFH99_00675 [Candidatus Saccharimonadales bacterium]|nr:hypothetical protein [Candidatus Saccharimonadales bacterium]